MKVLCGVIALACAPFALARNDAAYPKERVAAFVIEKLDATSFPSAIRPKPEKGKKTFGDYGYATQRVSEDEAVVELAGKSRISIRVLEQRNSGIYVCADGQGLGATGTRIQRVLLLKRKNTNGLLRSRDSLKEFPGCPVIGAGDSDNSTDY